MKKIYFLSAFIWCLFALAACGKKTEEDSVYYEIKVESQELNEIEKGWFLLGQQYYQGEPVSLIAEPSEAGETADAMDVYICSMSGDRKLLMSGVSSQYRVRGWYVDEKGRCFVRGTAGITGLDGDGKLLYYSPLSDLVTDICCTERGRVILLTQKTGGGRVLVELDPDTGSTAPMENIFLELGGVSYINSLGDDLLILDDSGVWQVDLKKGTKNLMLSFKGTTYSLETGGTITDFWSDGSGIDILWSSGKSDHLKWADINDSGKEIITVRAAYPDMLKEALYLFNQSNDAYYAVLDESGLNRHNLLTGGDFLTDFQTQTNLKITSGKGADIICSDALSGDVFGLIEKGVFADLAPMMEASGIREEDYFRAAFDAWRDGDKIYGIEPYMLAHSNSLDKAVLNGREELTIETLVDSMLEFEEDRCFSKSMEGGNILYYFLEGSENLWGMVDWEKGTCDFNGELFSKMLMAAKRYGSEEMRRQYPEIIVARQCSHIYEFDTAKKLTADNRVEMGVFFDGGNYPWSVVYTGNEIIMGINAASEHVEGAWQLLAFLLGEEAQSAIIDDIYLDFYYPVNKNVFDRLAQAELKYGYTSVNQYSGETVFIPGRNLGPKYGRVVLEEQAVIELRQMLSEARSLPYKTAPLLNIIAEETAYYFDGAKSMEEVIKLVQNRVQLYLNEHN